MELPPIEKPIAYEPPATLQAVGALFFRLPGTVRKFVVIGAVLGLIVLIAVVASSAFSFGRHWADDRFDKEIAERKATIADLEAKRAELINRAEAAEAQAVIIQEQVAALKQLATDAGVSSKQAEEKARAIDDVTSESVARVRANPGNAASELAGVREAIERLNGAAAKPK